MTRHVVIGTAGHVDHGKTTLVKALTGVDTDRWEEEKRRGITIDIGFAPLDLGDGVRASVVDVPGHEDFIRNMVAGATGVDVALLVVAADESVMPQTVEHVAILDALGVTAGVVALAKADLVEPGWLDLVTGEIRERLAGSGVRWKAVLPVSALTGTGLTELKSALRNASADPPIRRSDDLFRMPVDRAFSVAGAGTVVTGTTWSGSVRAGDEVLVLPGDHRARVRGVQVHDAPAAAAEPGRRTAIALVGVDRDAVPRGSAVVAGPGWRATDVLDVLITLLPGAGPLTQRSRVRLHLGTAEIMARVTPSAEGIPAGGAGTARLRLESPVAARWGDRGVLRSWSPITTIGGCVVADPWPADRPRRPADAAPLLGAPVERVAALVRRAGDRGVGIQDLPVRLGIAPGAVAGLVSSVGQAGVRGLESRLVAVSAVDAAREQVKEALGAFHRRSPLAPGMPLEAIRQLLGSADLADAVIADLIASARAVADGSALRLATHEPGAEALRREEVGRVGNAFREAGFEGRTLPELVPAGSAADVSSIVDYLVREGRVVRVGRDRYYDAEVLDQMVRATAQIMGESGDVGVAQLRDRLGLTRKYLIPFVEWLDAQGYTVRNGDVRRAGPRLTKSQTTL
jgi:selenocysteine-specific elongation factor